MTASSSWYCPLDKGILAVVPQSIPKRGDLRLQALLPQGEYGIILECTPQRADAPRTEFHLAGRFQEKASGFNDNARDALEDALHRTRTEASFR